MKSLQAAVQVRLLHFLMVLRVSRSMLRGIAQGKRKGKRSEIHYMKKMAKALIAPLELIGLKVRQFEIQIHC
jgi:hypothetical protein